MKTRRLSISTLFGIVVLLPILIVSVVLLLLSRYTSYRIEHRLSNALVASTSSMVRYKVLDSLRDARWISDLYALRARDGIVPYEPAPNWERLMHASVLTRNTLAAITYITPEGKGCTVARTQDGIVLGRSDGFGEGQTAVYALDDKGIPILPPQMRFAYDVREREWFQMGLNSPEPRWTPVFTWKAGDAPSPVTAASVSYVRAIRKPDGQIAGVLAIDVSLDTFTELLEQSDLARRGTLLLLDEQNRVVSAAGAISVPLAGLPSIESVNGPGMATLREAMREAGDGADLQLSRNDLYLSVSDVKPFPGINWRLAAIVPETGINAETAAFQRSMAITGAVASVLAVVLGLALARVITKPVRTMAEAVRKIGAGSFDTRVPADRTSELSQLAAALNDMAGRVREQVRLRAEKEAIERAASAKNAFFNRVTHELRTPLNAIIGYTEMLEEQDKIQADPVIRDDLRRITQASEQLLALINDLLDLAKAESGLQSLKLLETEIEPLLDEVQAITLPLAARRNNQLVVSTTTRPGHTLYTDPRRLRQILLNLLSNAAKFTENGRITLTASTDDSHVCFTVTDTGVGMDTAEIERMFQPFAQSDMSTEGTGLGLAITRQLTHLLGGEIEVTSRRGIGTTVYLYFPAESSTVLRRAGEAASSAGVVHE